MMLMEPISFEVTELIVVVAVGAEKEGAYILMTLAESTSKPSHEPSFPRGFSAIEREVFTTSSTSKPIVSSSARSGSLRGRTTLQLNINDGGLVALLMGWNSLQYVLSIMG
jgi:hypothetical protein